MADFEVPLKYVDGADTYTIIDPRYEPGAAPSGDLEAWDVRNWVNSGETWDQTGAGFVNAILQRAINALNTLYLSDGVPRQVYIPNGTYRIGFNISCKSGVGIKGQSEQGVIFMTEASSFIGGVIAGAAEIRDAHFETFTLDGINVTSDATKGFYFQQVVNCTFTHVTVQNTMATGFGIDHLDGVRFDHCTAIGCGRAVFVNNDESLPGRSGFGLGCGDVVRNREPVSLIGCVARDNGKFGIFIERQIGGDGADYPPGLKVIGCHMEGNLYGYGDVGAHGAIFTGNTVLDQRTNGAGVLIGPTTLAGAGRLGIFAHNLIAYNPIGVKVSGTSIDAYLIEGNEIRENTGDGLQVSGTVPAGFIVRGNRIQANGGKGLSITAGHTDLTIDNNYIRDNTGDDLSLTGAGTVSGLTVRLNDLRGSTVTITQTITTGLTVHDNLGWTYP